MKSDKDNFYTKIIEVNTIYNFIVDIFYLKLLKATKIRFKLSDFDNFILVFLYTTRHLSSYRNCETMRASRSSFNRSLFSTSELCSENVEQVWLQYNYCTNKSLLVR